VKIKRVWHGCQGDKSCHLMLILRSMRALRSGYTVLFSATFLVTSSCLFATTCTSQLVNHRLNNYFFGVSIVSNRHTTGRDEFHDQEFDARTPS